MNAPTDPREFSEYIRTVLIPQWESTGKLINGRGKKMSVTRGHLLSLLETYFENSEEVLPHLLYCMDIETDATQFNGWGCSVLEEYTFKPNKKTSSISKIPLNIQRILSMLSRPAAKDLLKTISTENELGVFISKKKDSLQSFALNCKRSNPNNVILIRVGEFYQALGVDCIILLEYTSASSMTKEITVACVHVANIQKVLTELIERGLSIAVYEESEVLQTPRLRYLSQIVSAACPNYYNGRGVYDTYTCEALPVVCVQCTQCSICRVFIEERRCEVFMDLDEAFCRNLCENFAPPLLCYRQRVPASWNFPQSSCII